MRSDVRADEIPNRLERRSDRVDIDRLIVGRQYEATRIGLYLGGVESVGLVNEIVFADVFDLNVFSDLPNFTTSVKEQLPARGEMVSPLLALVHAAGEDVAELHHGFSSNSGIHLRSKAGKLHHHDLRRRAR